ncbi:MAG: RnfABCDGE type electron transport complex subunit G [Oscillospiraceae bacterium]
MKLNFKNVVAPALILFTICFVISSLLSVTNMLTKDKITESMKAKEEESRQIVLQEAESFVPAADNSYFTGKKGEEIVGFVFITEAKGYGGTVKVMTGIGSDDQVKGVVILNQNETPGLGANATKASFTDQFKQAAQPLQVGKGTSGDGQISAMTGATITTKAVTNAVNTAIEAYSRVKGGN